MTDLQEPFPILSLDDMAYAYGKPSTGAVFKQNPEDFQVNEQISFEPSGEGTHAYLYIQKTDTNTQWLAKQLARFAGIPERDIGYAGLKDRHAVTRQWFSINLEGITEPNWDELQIPGVEIKQATYHQRKLKTGAIAHNQFIILLRDIPDSTQEELTQRLELIQQQGVPNYFGQQRFGIDGNNLTKARDWFSGQRRVKRRDEKSIYLSAARSMLFNQLLSQRIQQQAWNQLLPGEVMMLDGSKAVFQTEGIDSELENRFKERDIHPTAALWGRGRLSSSDEILALEQPLSENYPNWCKALEEKGLKQERRATRLFAENLHYEFLPEQQLKLQFELRSGSYATALLRELVRF